MPPHNRTQHTLQYPSPIQARPALAHPRHGIDHIAHLFPTPALPGQRIVQILQHLLRLAVLAHLEELHAHLPSRGVETVKTARGRKYNALDIITSLAVGDDDDVQRLDAVFALLLEVAEVGFEDGVQAGAGGCSAAGPHAVEDGFDVGGRGHVAVFGAVGLVEEVDVDAVAVVLGADRGDGFECVGGLAPGAAGHGTGVIDEEDGVEGGEEGEIGVFGIFDRVAGGGNGRLCDWWGSRVGWGCDGGGVGEGISIIVVLEGGHCGAAGRGRFGEDAAEGGSLHVWWWWCCGGLI